VTETNGHTPLSEADNEIVKLVALGFEQAMHRMALRLQRWLGALLLRSLAWAGGLAALAVIGWAFVRSQT
jgi:hypothetical protein